MKLNNKIIISIAIVFLLLLGTFIIKILSNRIQLLEDVTLEIGTKVIDISNFYVNGKTRPNSSFITNVDNIDLNRVGDYTIEIKDDNKTKNVMLHIVDTTPPVVVFKDIIKGMNYNIDPNDFIESVIDASDYTVDIENPPIIKEFKDYNVMIVVKDKYNNTTKKECKLTLSVLAPTYTLELGDKLTKEDILYDKNANDYLKSESIEKINNAGIGNYEIKMTYNNKDYICKVTVKDTKGPELELKNLSIYLGEKISGKDAFIVSVKDASNKVTTKLKESYDDNKIGTQTIVIEAIDEYGNKTEKSATLTIKKDNDAPVFSGLSEIKTDKNKSINYEKGVTAIDKKDGKVEFTVDSDSVDVTKQGTYYAIYKAKDNAGNVATKKRKIIVNHDSRDLNELINEYSLKAGNDYESIRKYVQQTIKYSDSWGENDAVWYGLTRFQGNCYVHALTYKAFLDRKGYENKLIWTTDKSHYWNLIKINGVWRHSDSTPGTKHIMISAETDDVRYAHLQGRDWNRSAWPEAV